MVYPIAPGGAADRRLTNWAVRVATGRQLDAVLAGYAQASTGAAPASGEPPR
ncbi:MAG TPA: hypothetical protein VEZ42_14250 [Pseudonocardia sp.]|nr:hypothetical protein [Pseudonocardia sp.]